MLNHTACLLSLHFPVLGEDKGPLPFLSSSPRLSSLLPTLVGRLTGAPVDLGWCLEVIKPTWRELSTHPSGLPPSLCGRRGLARQEEPQVGVQMWKASYGLARKRPTPHPNLSHLLLQVYLAQLPTSSPVSRMALKTPVILHLLPFSTPSFFLECPSGPCLPVEFLFILQIQA